MLKLLNILFIAPVLCLLSCTESTPIPRKYGFHRIEFPNTTQYKSFDNRSCPFTFEYPVEGEIVRDFKDSCWVDIEFERYGLTWHLNYRNANEDGRDRNFHFEEHRKLIYKHSKKASEIRPFQFTNSQGYGTLHEVYGNVGTPAYIFFSDTADQDIFVMSFYFQTALKNDSLAPVIDYMKGEVRHMVESLRWE